MELKTIKIKNDSELGYRFINEEDYDSSQHELFEIEESKPVSKKRKVDQDLPAKVTLEE